jgi:hypothetical protein
MFLLLSLWSLFVKLQYITGYNRGRRGGLVVHMVVGGGGGEMGEGALYMYMCAKLTCALQVPV